MAKNVNFFKGASGILPGEWELQNAQIERQRQMAEALKQQSADMPEGQMVSGHYVAPSITQYLAQGLKGYQANKQLADADQKQLDIINGEKTKQQELATQLLGGLKPQQSEQDLSYEDAGGMPGATQTVTTQPDYAQSIAQYLANGGSNEALVNLAQNEANYSRGRADKLDDRSYQAGREDFVYGRNRGDHLQDMNTQRQWQVTDKGADREFQRIMQDDSQGFQLSQQDKLFAQQWKQLQAQQGFQAGENAKTRAEARRTAASGGDWKYDSGSDTWVKPPTPENPNGQRILSPDKQNAASSLNYVIQQFEGNRDDAGNVIPGTGQLGKTSQGGFLGMSGKVGKLTNYQEAKRFDNLREQLSTELRTLFRIPGEGALSDQEQKQYGMQLPSTDYDSDTNQKILNDIKNRVSLRQGGTSDRVQVLPRDEKMPAKPNVLNEADAILKRGR